MRYPLLTRLEVRGFRSLREVRLDLGELNVLIGPNGAGKSNLLAVLRMIALMRTGSLRRYVGEQGGASSLLHYGPSFTRELNLRLTFDASEKAKNGYFARLGYAAGNGFTLLDEMVTYQRTDRQRPIEVPLGSGHAESLLAAEEPPAGLDEIAQDTLKKTRTFVSRIGYFHFHDTSPTSPLRQSSRPAENRYLRSDGSNLAAFLYRLRRSEGEDRHSWNLFVALVGQIAPFIKSLEPDFIDPDNPGSHLMLYWTDHRDYRFDVHDLSDGTLRAIALLAALAQPEKTLPKFIAIDEPELGLHPAAIGILASLLRSVSTRAQILLATQSPALLDEFAPEEVAVIETRAGESTIRRLEPDALAAWLDDYSLAQLYDKNILGGRP